ncbi:MAG: ATP-binding protein [bacterium]|nr:ATP-binding protein [bacterium]
MALTNRQYDELMRSYEQKQFHARHIQAERKAKIYAELPELSQIDEAIASFSVKQARLLLDGDEHALVILKDQLAKAKKRREQILSDAGYTPADLEPAYECPDCKDTGYIGSKRCHCMLQSSLDLVYRQSNLTNLLNEENFSHFREDYYSDTLTDPVTGLSARAIIRYAYNEAQNFIRDFDKTHGNLFFYGETGVGKTFLSNCIAKELLDTGHSVLYFSAFALFELLEKCKFDREPEAMARQEDLFSCDLLIIDDLGTELSNSFTVSQLFLCLNERILRKKSTIISTNLGIDQVIDIYSDRTFSRIRSNYSLIKLVGEDIRHQKKRS